MVDPDPAITAEWTRTEADRLAVANGCYFDLAAAEHVRDFFRELLVHSKGQFAGQPFELLEWQWLFIIAPLFGWKRADGTRRFRVAYIKIAKKNGKSTLCSGIALYCLIADGEDGAEVYSAACDRDQAGIVYDEGANMVDASTELCGSLVVKRSQKCIEFPATKSKYEAISADAYTNEGKNASVIIFDELHALKNRDFFEALRYAGIARRQPLFIIITTAGDDLESLCYEQEEYAKQVLSGAVQDDRFFAYIAEAAPEDDWKSPEAWKKANPSLGVTMTLESFEEAIKEAERSPRLESVFRRYRLNQWVAGDNVWLGNAVWSEAGMSIADESTYHGRPAWGAIDLSRKRDLAAWVLAVDLDSSTVLLLPRLFMPKGRIEEAEKRDHVPYRAWAAKGLITLTEGDVVHYPTIRATVQADARHFEIREIAYDPWNAANLCEEVMSDDGFDMVEFRQQMPQMGPASAEFERRLKNKTVLHPRHPILDWMARNATVTEDHNGNFKPSKKNSRAHIDGITAAVMAVARASAGGGKTASVYEERGLIAL